MARADRVARSPCAYLTNEERNQKINGLLARFYSGLTAAEKTQLLNDVSQGRKNDSGALQQLFSLKEKLGRLYGEEINDWPKEKRKEVLRLHIIIILARMSEVDAIGYLEGQGVD